MRPSLESLRVLEACVSAGSFARAAECLFLTPAAVSLRIRTLEAELDQPLFVRAGPRVTPTAAATILAKRVREALNGISDALNEFQAAAPSLKVTAPPTFASRWLAPRLARYPAPGAFGIELDVSTEMRDPQAFDVAIRTGGGGWAGFEEYPLAPVEVTPMLAPSLLAARAIATPDELIDFELLPHPDWEQWFMEAGCKAPPGLRFAAVDYPTHELDANAALAGAGVALLSPSLFRPLLTQGLLIAPFACVLSGPAWHFALMRAGESRSAPQHFCAWLCEQARALA
ncbi:LysR family transcriptional regulator [Terrarubrum flagellatum]|uniref:LysR family transcriptional regulator n=1 Tax=Terrirubrum flagellatum TaxID=2895980 RepID=UPI003145450D